MKILSASFITIITMSSMFLVACSDSLVTTPVKVDTTVIARSDVRADSVVGWVYYSIDGDSVVPSDSASTASWDVCMQYLQCCGKTRNIFIRLNSGNVGVGGTRGAIVKSRFENVKSLPSGTVLRNDDTLSPVIAFIGVDPVWVYQGAPNHTLAPSPDKTIAIKTRTGRLVKFQFTSIYEGAPVTPTQDSPIGYYHFRYANLSQ
ncbi:MAG: HmuY family protein [Candidatus Kapabacteria bacterium]|nr:HmuY family protein [Candidatus Kapabacteria bacterium]